MDPDELTQAPLAQAQDIALTLAARARDLPERADAPWNAYQLGIALAVFALAHLLGMILRPRLYEWMRGLEGWPKWQMRMLVIIHRRLRMILFVLLMWVVFTVMQDVTWPSRSYILGVIAELATAWLFIVFATRLIAQRLLRAAVRYGAWAWVTLSILGLTGEARTVLDSFSLSIGETRLSLWLLLQAAVTLGLLIFVARFIATTSSARIRRNEEISPVDAGAGRSSSCRWSSTARHSSSGSSWSASISPALRCFPAPSASASASACRRSSRTSSRASSSCSTSRSSRAT